jgi:hypothetical protein
MSKRMGCGGVAGLFELGTFSVIGDYLVDGEYVQSLSFATAVPVEPKANSNPHREGA